MRSTWTARSGLGIIKKTRTLGLAEVKFGEPFDYPGVQVFGWWVNAPPPEPLFLQSALQFWDPGTVELLAERDFAEEEDGSLHQNALYVKINEFPSSDEAWKRSLESTLALFVEKGAAIAWAGGYSCMWHYHPTENMAGCYAAYTAGTGLLCASRLDEPLRFLREFPELVQRLHDAVGEQRRVGPHRK